MRVDHKIKTWIRIVLGVVVVLAVITVLVGGLYLSRIITVGAGRAAKLLCSNVFVSRRTAEAVLQEELADMASVITIDVDGDQQQVTVTLGPVERRAIYRQGLGCTMIPGDGDALGNPIVIEAAPLPDGLWPEGNLVSLDELPTEVDRARLAAALDNAFAEPDLDHPVNARAVVVVYNGHIIAERYAPGFAADTPLISWSMAKSVTNALVGVLVREGRLSLDGSAPVPEWSDPSDPRHAITLDQLLRMSSGLEFEEEYSALADVSVMLFNTHNMAAYAASKPLETDPGAAWHYSSGTSNIISRIVCDAVGPGQDCLAFPRHALFDPIGMRSAVFEPDASGTPVGSSYVYATARDWARFGLLYLQDGVWDGERILPPGWVAYTTTPTPGSEGRYGAHWWLKKGDPADWRWSDFPDDLFLASGYDGQFVVLIPSRGLVIVRLGFTPDPEAWDLAALIGDVLEAVPASE